MSPIFKNSSEAALALKKLITDESLSLATFTSINPDAIDFCQQVNHQLTPFPDIHPQGFLVIIDDGSTRASEFVNYTDSIRHQFPQTQIIIATPFVPQSEEAIFKNNCDRLLTLHVEALFFDINQFYQQT